MLAWGAALNYLRGQRRVLAVAAGLVLVGVAFAHVTPGLHAWGRGFLTATFVAAALWLLAWVGWVWSGTAFRIQGAWAEDVTGQLLNDLPNVMGVVPSLKSPNGDVDHVAITPGFIFAVETKWTASKPSAEFMQAAARQAERGAQRLRRELHFWKEPVGAVRVVPAVIVQGPQVPDDLDHVAVGLDELIRVMHPTTGRRRIGAVDTGLIGPDFAKDLTRRLDAKARERDQFNFTGGWLLRRLARTH